MGKQKGDGARSKTRPSSSNLSASLLQSETASVGFGGYVGSTRIDMTSTTEQSTLLDIDSEVTQHLRRVSKKDPTTKLKALTSLSTLFRQIPASELCQIAPQWVFEYKRLVLDNSRQVRQAAHDAMANLAFTIGRGLAPHLRSVMGAWWLGQFDPFTEVSEAAKRSFQVAFPVQEKRLEALIFCGNEIFHYLDENLKLTPQTIHDKTAPIEELEEMHELVVSSSLLALASLLDVFIGTYLQRSASENGCFSDGLDLKNAAKARSSAITAAEKICRTHKFFQEILKSQSSRVRSAVYQVLLSFVKYVPQVFSEGDMKIPASIVLGSFQEKDPTCHSSMWNMLLFFTGKFPEAWRAAPLQKVILPRLWCFLRRGCYGSQQASYPCLLPMLSSMPPGTISAEQFFIDFFRSLWEGNSTCLHSPADQVALFKAMKECFMWIVNNASRYVEDGLCSIENFRVRLIECIIFKLLWYDYITKGKSCINNGALVDKDGDLATKSIQTTAQNIQVKLLPNYPKSFMQELGNYIIEILSSISTLDPSLLHAFSDQFQIESLKIIQLSGDGASLECNQHMDQLSDFFSLLGTCLMDKGENWPLVYLARPFAAKSFPLIKSMGSPPAVTLLSIIISFFGASVLPLESFVNKGGESHVQFHTSYNQECQPEVLLQFFKNNLVKWCLCMYDYSTSSKLDLLLAFLEDVYFQSQWDWIFGCAAEVENESVEEDVKTLSSDRITLLATLMEKVRYKFIDKKVLKKSRGMVGFEAKDWYSMRLDVVAVAIARRNTLKNPSCVQFLRCVLGGAEEDPVLLISKEAARLVIEELLKHLTSALMESPIAWTKYASSLILPNGIEDCLQTNKASLDETLQIANFSAQVLDGSLFCLKVLDDSFEIVPHILAAPIFLDWETRMSYKSGLSSSSLDLWEIDDEAFDKIDIGSAHYQGKSTDEISIDQADEGTAHDNAQEQDDIRLGFVKSVQALRSRITSFCKSFSLSSLNRLRWVLIETIRCAVFQEDVCEAQKIVSMCIEWVMEVMDHTCRDQDEEQQMLDHLLFLSDACPSWAKPPALGESKLSTLKSINVPNEADKNMHTRFVMFVERIGLALGKDKLLFGSLMKTSHITMENTSSPIRNEISSCRIWLAVEVLCTWKWPGGSAVEYLLPFLCECAKNDPGHPQQIMVNSIINILFTGALTNSALDNFYPLNAWPISAEEVDKIEEPFLRALVMLLAVLFKDGSVWTKADASRLLHYFQKKEFQNVSTVNNFTRIIPHILQILVPILRKRTANLEENNQDFSLAEVDTGNMQENTCQWLQRGLSGPPLILCQMGQPDIEEWVRVAVSCFPLRSVGGMATLVSAANISTQERELLLALFQKQASQEAISGYHALAAERRASLATVSNGDIRWEQARELSLARLMAVAIGYCWQEFGEHEWVFVLAQLRKWLESVVGHMEELAEGIHDATRVKVYHTIEYVEKVVNGSRDFPMDLAETAIFIFSLLFGLHNLDGAEMTSSLNFLNAVNWERAEIRAFEDILRLFFATGLAESIASSSCSGKAAGAVIALSRQRDVRFWENVATIVLCAPSRAREAAMRAADLWGLRKGGINALYAILFSVHPISSLQWAAYNFLSTDPVQPFGVTKEVLSSQSEEGTAENGEADQTTDMDSSSEEPSFVRAELHSVLQTPPSDLLKSHLTADNRVRYLLGWSLFLTRLQAVPSLSAARERMVQYIQDFGSPSTLLDFLFQHIPLKQSSSPGLKKKGNAAVIEETSAATAARQSAATNSLSFAVEALWPIGIEEMATLAGAVYGLMLRVLPTYVRDWFTSLRDRSAAFSIEAFTTAWCSPQLLADEFSQIQAAGIADETLSIKANRSSREVTAIYKKEEAGMDVVIRLPSCYPLRAVDVECTRKLGVSENRLRKWMLSMAAFVRNQNGAIAEAVHIWKRNIDREFEGVEECPICYSIIHTTNHGLPRLACKTCKHKFHSACLYKWFSTSHKSTCPLCQTPF